MNTRLKKRINAVEYYLKQKKSLRASARKFKVSHLTLWRWVNWFKQGGKENLDREQIFKPWNKFERVIENKIVLLKEKNPSLTVSKAKAILLKQELKISTNGIWSVWKRYGLAGLAKITNEEFFDVLPVKVHAVSPLLKRAKDLLNAFDNIQFAEYYKKARRLRLSLEKKRLNYTAMRVGFTEAIALSWIAKSKKHLSLIYHLKKWIPKRNNLYLRYQLVLHEGIAHARLLKIKKALLCAKQCHKILKKIQNVPQLWRELANLYYHIGRCHDALQIVEKILNGDFGTFKRNDRDFFYADRANLLATSGQYRQCLATLNKIDERKPVFRALILMLRAQCMLGQANIYEAAGYARRAIELAQKNEILTSLHAASLIFAGISAATGEGTKARAVIRRLNPLFKKSRMEKNIFVREFLSSSNTRRLRMKKYKVEMLSHPVCLLVFLMAKASSTLKLTDYRHAYNYAATHSLLGLFHRFLLFFPEPLIKLLDKKKPTGLPTRYLQLPVFKRDVPVYRVNFLGATQVCCGNRVRKNLPPKDISFIIYLATAKTRRIPVDVIYQKFWPTSQKPSRNLSHLLVRVRKALELTIQYLNVIQDNLQCDCQFITDYEEFETHIAQAKALERIDKWKMAEKVYCQAFLLFRGKPFAKMYDNFSEEKRLEVLFKFEENARHFVEELKKNGDKQKKMSNAVTITLQRITEIAPSLQGCFFESFKI